MKEQLLVIPMMPSIKKYEREGKLTFKMHILLEDNSRAVAFTVGQIKFGTLQTL
jgi:hypothetical protein